MDLWAYQRNVTLDFSRPGKPTDNEPPRVYRRVIGSNVRLLFQRRSRLGRISPLLLVA
jgi:hypothetical protein